MEAKQSTFYRQREVNHIYLNKPLSALNLYYTPIPLLLYLVHMDFGLLMDLNGTEHLKGHVDEKKYEMEEEKNISMLLHSLTKVFHSPKNTKANTKFLKRTQNIFERMQKHPSL